jgi:hypothetical protein
MRSASPEPRGSRAIGYLGEGVSGAATGRSNPRGIGLGESGAPSSEVNGPGNFIRRIGQALQTPAKNIRRMVGGGGRYGALQNHPLVEEARKLNQGLIKEDGTKYRALRLAILGADAHIDPAVQAAVNLFAQARDDKLKLLILETAFSDTLFNTNGYMPVATVWSTDPAINSSISQIMMRISHQRFKFQDLFIGQDRWDRQMSQSLDNVEKNLLVNMKQGIEFVGADGRERGGKALVDAGIMMFGVNELRNHLKEFKAHFAEDEAHFLRNLRASQEKFYEMLRESKLYPRVDEAVITEVGVALPKWVTAQLSEKFNGSSTVASAIIGTRTEIEEELGRRAVELRRELETIDQRNNTTILRDIIQQGRDRDLLKASTAPFFARIPDDKRDALSGNPEFSSGFVVAKDIAEANRLQDIFAGGDKGAKLWLSSEIQLGALAKVQSRLSAQQATLEKWSEKLDQSRANLATTRENYEKESQRFLREKEKNLEENAASGSLSPEEQEKNRVQREEQEHRLDEQQKRLDALKEELKKNQDNHSVLEGRYEERIAQLRSIHNDTKRLSAWIDQRHQGNDAFANCTRILTEAHRRFSIDELAWKFIHPNPDEELPPTQRIFVAERVYATYQLGNNDAGLRGRIALGLAKDENFLAADPHVAHRPSDRRSEELREEARQKRARSLTEPEQLVADYYRDNRGRIGAEHAVVVARVADVNGVTVKEQGSGVPLALKVIEADKFLAVQEKLRELAQNERFIEKAEVSRDVVRLRHFEGEVKKLEAECRRGLRSLFPDLDPNVKIHSDMLRVEGDREVSSAIANMSADINAIKEAGGALKDYGSKVGGLNAAAKLLGYLSKYGPTVEEGALSSWR